MAPRSAWPDKDAKGEAPHAHTPSVSDMLARAEAPGGGEVAAAALLHEAPFAATASKAGAASKAKVKLLAKVKAGRSMKS